MLDYYKSECDIIKVKLLDINKDIQLSFRINEIPVDYYEF